MNKVLVLDTNRKPLMPCHPRRARKLLESGRASVFRRYPFTIIIHDRTKIPVGTYTGRVAVRSNGVFNVRTKDTKIAVPYRYCKLIHLMDGYTYT